MGILIDSSVLIARERARRGGSGRLESLEPHLEEPVFVAAITASELLHGVHRADSPARRALRETFVEAVFAAVPVLPFDLEVARIHAGLWADLASRGLTIGVHDLLIAATAVRHGLSVLTRDARHFGRIAGLDVVAV